MASEWQASHTDTCQSGTFVEEHDQLPDGLGERDEQLPIAHEISSEVGGGLAARVALVEK